MEVLWQKSEFDDLVEGIFKFPPQAAALPCGRLSFPPRPNNPNTSSSQSASWLYWEEGTDDWSSWFSDTRVFKVSSKSKAFACVLIPRAPNRPHHGYPSNSHPAVLSYLPFQESVFDEIKKKLLLHRSAAIIIDRGAPVIARVPASFENVERRVYVFRVQHSLSDHTALAVTHVPGDPNSMRGSKTYAVVFGCSDKDMLLYRQRLSRFPDTISYPITIIKVFLQLERDRRFAEVDRRITEFETKLLNAERLGHGGAPEDFISLYLDVTHLNNNLSAWQVQLERFIKSSTADFRVLQGEKNDIDAEIFLRMMADEYQIKIDKCDMVLQGASLAFQMETTHLSRVDTSIALRDGKQMKAAALLTMFFLPGTFVATLLAVPQLKVLEDIGNFASWLWYLIFSLPLKAVVLGAYGLWVKLYQPKDLAGFKGVA